MRLPWSRRSERDADDQSARIDQLRAEGETRLAESQDTRRRLESKMRYQEGRHRVNAVYEEAAWVLTRAGRATG